MSWACTSTKLPAYEADVIRTIHPSAMSLPMEQGGRVVGLTGGQYSMLDVLRATLEKTGPADVAISTWTFGIRDAETAAWLLGEGKIRSLRFLVDDRFPRRKPEYAARMLEVFGPKCFVLLRCHAKFALVRNEAWDVAITGSMNLNRNRQIEHFTWEEGGPVPTMFWDFTEAAAIESPHGLKAVRNAKKPWPERWAEIAKHWGAEPEPVVDDFADLESDVDLDPWGAT